MDVRVLHMSVTKEITYFVDILVSLKESNEIGNASQDIRITEPFLNEGVMHTDGNEFLGKFETPNAKIYLSHPWKNYISLVKIMSVERMSSGIKKDIEMGFEFEYVANKYKRITTSCIKKYIEVVCGVANGHFVIRTLNNQHTCTGRIRERKNGMMTSKLVCSILVEQIRSNPHIKPIQIVDDFKKNYGLDVSYYNAWYGKEMAMTRVHGDDVLSYQKLG
ncbi:hypothetical protein DVH24_033540 [Malus domestica]|uniref:Transposase MuDR plant domain-containing protein n=1 Tax=Malus domestica TaxID=3750 RepID=A0A498JF29_MALDO|nr:hypothetical protein DVH24_033540 [Malus domestica]